MYLMSLFIIFESLIKLTIKFTDCTGECERFEHEVFSKTDVFSHLQGVIFLRSASWICGNLVKYIHIHLMSYFGLF